MIVDAQPRSHCPLPYAFTPIPSLFIIAGSQIEAGSPLQVLLIQSGVHLVPVVAEVGPIDVLFRQNET